MSQSLLVIPHYRDTLRLRPFLKSLIETLPKHFTILISDDGSDDEEVARLCTLVREFQNASNEPGPTLLAALLHAPNTGKGGAVLRGWDHYDEFSLLIFADADGAVSANEIVRSEQFVRSSDGKLDALFGSRVKMLGRSINRLPLRHVMGRVFATFVSLVAGVGAYDTQCGLKILTSETFQRIRPNMKCLGFAFDVEICLLLLKTGSKVIEFPVDWRDVAGSKVRLLRDSVRMAVEVIRIRRRVAEIQT